MTGIYIHIDIGNILMKEGWLCVMKRKSRVRKVPHELCKFVVRCQNNFYYTFPGRESNHESNSLICCVQWYF